jgi:hypothetical protein
MSKYLSSISWPYPFKSYPYSVTTRYTIINTTGHICVLIILVFEFLRVRTTSSGGGMGGGGGERFCLECLGLRD